MTRSLVIYGFIAFALVFFHLVKTRSRSPERLYLLYTAVVAVAVLALFAYNVLGAITTGPPVRGSYIALSILSGLFAAGTVWGTWAWWHQIRRS